MSSKFTPEEEAYDEALLAGMICEVCEVEVVAKPGDTVCADCEANSPANEDYCEICCEVRRGAVRGSDKLEIAPSFICDACWADRPDEIKTREELLADATKRAEALAGAHAQIEALRAEVDRLRVQRAAREVERDEARREVEQMKGQIDETKIDAYVRFRDLADKRPYREAWDICAELIREVEGE